jgi:hypothetical protein
MHKGHAPRLTRLRDHLLVLSEQLKSSSQAFLRSAEAELAYRTEFKALGKVFEQHASVGLGPDPLLFPKLRYKRSLDSHVIHLGEAYTLVVSRSTEVERCVVAQLWQGRRTFPWSSRSKIKPLRQRLYVLAVAPASRLLSDVGIGRPYGWKHRMHDDEGFLTSDQLASEVFALALRPRLPGLVR